MKKSISELAVISIKFIVYALLFFIFFIKFSLENAALNNLSRTLVITSTTFIVVGVLMMFVYGNFEIGKKKTKPIIYSTVIGILFTDLVTYLQLMIMNTNPNNNVHFRLEQLDTLLWVVITQSIVIIIGSYIGNRLYFSLYSPLRTVFILGSDCGASSLQQVQTYISRFKLQYKVEGTLSAADVPNLDTLKQYDYVVFIDVPSPDRKPWIDACYELSLNFSYSPSISDVLELSGEYVTFDDKPMIDVNVQGLSIEKRIFKRALDLVAAIVGIVLSFPIWSVAAIAIKLYDRGPILFKQERYTIDGKIFKVYKFRTMKENVENFSATEDDDRITKVGKVLRKIRMDELPQLLNILQGDMSLVGPRPEMLSNVEKYETDLPEFRYRLRVKAGLTGMAQIEGKYNTSPYDKLIMDLVYIENYSIWSDIKLILRTVTVLFKSDSTEAFDSSEKD